MKYWIIGCCLLVISFVLDILSYFGYAISFWLFTIACLMVGVTFEVVILYFFWKIDINKRKKYGK
jgi:hypothetical protein